MYRQDRKIPAARILQALSEAHGHSIKSFTRSGRSTGAALGYFSQSSDRQTVSVRLHQLALVLLTGHAAETPDRLAKSFALTTEEFQAHAADALAVFRTFPDALHDLRAMEETLGLPSMPIAPSQTAGGEARPGFDKIVAAVARHYAVGAASITMPPQGSKQGLPPAEMRQARKLAIGLLFVHSGMTEAAIAHEMETVSRIAMSIHENLKGELAVDPVLAAACTAVETALGTAPEKSLLALAKARRQKAPVVAKRPYTDDASPRGVAALQAAHRAERRERKQLQATWGVELN